MILELRTYRLRTGSVAAVEDLFERHLPFRERMSALGGLWHTLSGPLDVIVHAWPYRSIEERFAIRAAMMQPPHWPPPLRPYLVEMASTIVLPVPFSPPLEPAALGALYELHIDTHLPGGPAQCLEAWTGRIDARTRLSPLVFCGVTEFGTLNQWVHLWAYRDALHREEVLRDAAAIDWPPRDGRAKLVKEETVLLAPAACSPLR